MGIRVPSREAASVEVLMQECPGRDGAEAAKVAGVQWQRKRHLKMRSERESGLLHRAAPEKPHWKTGTDGLPECSRISQIIAQLLLAARHSVPCGSSSCWNEKIDSRGEDKAWLEMAELKFPWDIRQILHVRHHCCSIPSLLQVNLEVEATPPCHMGWLCDLLLNDLGKWHWVLRLSHKKTIHLQHGVLWAEPPRKMTSYHEGAMWERT